MSNPIQLWRDSSNGNGAAATGGRVAGYTLAALLLGLILMNVPDFLRYLRIRNM